MHPIYQAKEASRFEKDSLLPFVFLLLLKLLSLFSAVCHLNWFFYKKNLFFKLIFNGNIKKLF